MQSKDYRKKILSSVDAESFYIDEFKRLGLTYSRHGSELKGQCPFSSLHLSGQDSKPSFTVNLVSGVYLCNSCSSKGNIISFYTTTRGISKEQAWFDIGDELGFERPTDIDSRPAIDPGLPAKQHRELLQYTGPVRDILRDKRGLTDETLKKFIIGWDGDRVTIPIYDEFGELVNIRRYKWNSYEDASKMINYEDQIGNTFGEDRIYGIEHLYDPTCDTIVWCEGEWDRLIAEQNGFSACTTTAGAHNFRVEWYKQIRTKKRIYICYDNDEPGRLATNTMIDNLRNSLEIYAVQWPKDWREKGDVTDIFIKDGYTVEQFMELFLPIEAQEETPIVPLALSSNARYTGKRIKVPVLVAGKESAPYVYPKQVRISCSKKEEGNKLCEACMMQFIPRSDISVTSTTPLILKLINCPDEKQKAILKGAVGCNAKCHLCDFNILEYGNLETVHMIPKVDTNFGFALHQEYVARSGYVIGNGLPTNKRYTLIGYMHADPNTQKATYVFDSAIPEKDILEDSANISKELNSMLEVFKCAPGQSVADKFNEIHADLERNVTYIWERRSVGIAVDLVYHSAISFMFQEQQVKRGWVECLIIGDSGQAKTTLVERLMQHYRSGELLSGESSKRTGLVYSIQQMSSTNGWSLLWGAMPLNDGGLITVDELSGLPEDDLAKMSDVRSSGIAKSNGVVTAETTARTRIIFISNPRNGRQLRAENYGVSAVLKLFGKAEDVRRLDFAVGVSSGDVDADIVNKAVSEMPPVEQKYTSDVCHARVVWAWSRHPSNIIFEPDAVSEILKGAIAMGRQYVSTIPLVEPADQRLKIARLSVSAAACVYSTDDGTNIIVKVEHVAFVISYLCELYNSKALGYDRFSADQFENSDTTDAAMIRLRKGFIALPLVTRTIFEVAKALYQLPYFSRNTLEDATGLDRDELRALMQFLISQSIVEKANLDYKRTPLGLAFIEFMITQPPTIEEEKKIRAEYYASQGSEI